MKKLLVIVACLVATSTAFADTAAPGKQASPDDMKELMEMSLGAMVPMMGKMAEAMIDAQLKIAERPETAKRLATFKKNLFDELLKQGFSRKEAFDIMLNTAIPAAMPGMK